MDARLNREEHIKSLTSSHRLRKQTWYEWWYSIQPDPTGPVRTTDAATSKALKAHFVEILDRVEPPETFKPREVAEALTDKELSSMGYKKQEEAIPAVYELAFEMRDLGDCEILRKGVVIGDDVGISDLDGPIRIRRAVF
ncbi:uncharacterized protein RCC_03141 [Ramularia collo-cygni]|uniref:Uncharacterized protein n=1 Tax=Ramularia collo-cygni TaxID=112498 RepID=A0A2D3UYA4_9PEZI|nr:uncharacterized protein RCC_03141 [Ramularia collo-cygni]CZT17307.1 uncharacterized protein RCC_03141 [Ramularia collo-cygni]